MQDRNKEHRAIPTLILLVLLGLGGAASAAAGDAILTWDPPTTRMDGSPLTDLAGYRVYYGTASGSYGSPIDVGNVTTYTVTGLGLGTYYFAVKAYDTLGNESGFSNEVSKTISATDTTPPVVSGITAGNITSTGATISWTTDEPSDTQIQYGITTAYGSSTSVNTALVTAHSQGLTGLSSLTPYHYRVLSRDAAGNLASSGDNTFTTAPAPDTTPPALSGIVSSSITSSGATVSWTTDELSDSQVEYGTTTAYGSFTILNTSLVTAHNQNLTGLLPSTAYHYRVRSRDAAGNLAVSGDNTFTTAPAPDTTPPVISGVTASNITSTGAVITWTTNEAATSQVEYGTTTAYGSLSALDSTLVTSHSRTLSGLLSSITYHYRVVSTDGAGNTARSVDFTFTTSAPPDTTPPVISGITAGNITSTGATISWTTDEAATSQVQYGATTAYGSSTMMDPTLVTSHTVAPSGLATSSTYHYRVKSGDGAGNLATSGDFTFTTSAPPDTTPPVLSLIMTSNVTSNGAVISWGTDEPTTTQLEYGLTTAYGTSTIVNATLLNGHSQTLSGLQPSALYHYRVKSADGSGNLTVSGDNIFTTIAILDTTPPGDVLDFKAVGGNKRINLSWTDPPDTDFIGVRILFRTDRYPSDINDGTLLGDFTGQPNESVRTVHDGLQKGVTYYYAAHTYDIYGNFQNTVNASATPFDSADNQKTTISGGCGMVRPIDGTPPGPGQAADMMVLLAVMLTVLIKRRIQSLKLNDLNRLTCAETTIVSPVGLKKHFDKCNIVSDILKFVARLRSNGDNNLMQCFLMRRFGLCLTVSILLLFLSYTAAWAGEATLTWDPPTAHMDGSPLTDLAGYKVYGGTASGSHTFIDDVGNTTTYTATGLPEGQTFFVSVTAYDASNNESRFSNEVSLSIPAASPSVSGGCGMVLPQNGESSGPWQGADLLALMGILLLGLIRKSVFPNTRRFAMRTLTYSFVIGMLLCVWTASPAFAAFAGPTISSLSGTVSNGSTITITGSGFGIKNPVKPLIWANFEDGTTNPSNLGRYTQWTRFSDLSLTTLSQDTNSIYAVRGITYDGAAKFNPDLIINQDSGLTKVYAFVRRKYDASNWWSIMSGQFVNYKVFRLWTNEVGTNTVNPDATFNYNNSAPPILRIIASYPSTGMTAYGCSGTTGSWTYDGPTSSWPTPVQQWIKEEYQFSRANGTGVVKFWQNGTVVINVNNAVTTDPVHCTFTDPITGMVWGDAWHSVSIENYWTLVSPPANAYVYFDDVYIDDSWARVMVGDQPTFDASTHREIQIPSTWSDTSISVAVNQGSFASLNSVYMYVIDLNGNVNANGYPLCPSCPQPPKNLR